MKELLKKAYQEGRDAANYRHDEKFGGIEYWPRKPLSFDEWYEENT